jgi:hypothetical protein
MEDNSERIMAQLGPQMDALTSAMPGLLALGPNLEQMINMGKAMFQGALQIPPVSPVQACYVQGIRQLADVIREAPEPPA